MMMRHTRSRSSPCWTRKSVITASLIVLSGVIWTISFMKQKWRDPASLTTNSDKVVVDIQPLLSPEENDPWKRELFTRLDQIRTICGELCTVNDLETFQSRAIYDSDRTTTFPRLVADVNCDALMANPDIDVPDTTIPYPPPDELLPYYTLNGAIHFELYKKFENVYLGGSALNSVWSKPYVDKFLQAVKNGQLAGTYGHDSTSRVIQKLSQANLKDKSVLVIGSETPWMEAICLHLGVANITTLEYGAIQSEHPQIKAMTPDRFRQEYQEGTLVFFDAVLSFSSLEHSGLGRYGDALNPWGDILAVARAWCVTKSGGELFLGIPTGRDMIEFNAHRWYGKLRWPLVTTNWMQLDGDQHSENELTVEERGTGGTMFHFQKVEAKLSTGL